MEKWHFFSIYDDRRYFSNRFKVLIASFKSSAKTSVLFINHDHILRQKRTKDKRTRSQSCMSVCSVLDSTPCLHILVWKIKLTMDKLINSWLQYGVCHTRGDVILLTSTFNIQPMIRSLSTSNKVPRADLFVQSTTAASLCTVGRANEYVQTISGLCQNLSPDTLCLSLWMHYILLLQIIKFECEAPIKQSSHKYTHCTQIFMHPHTHTCIYSWPFELHHHGDCSLHPSSLSLDSHSQT